jgi:WD40 repeat protein
MKSSKGICGVIFAMFLVILLGLALTYYDSTWAGKEDKESSQGAEYLGSVPSESSLVNLAPEKDRQAIELKERWLDSEAKLMSRGKPKVSENGKYKVLLSAGREDMLTATFIDSNGTEIWSAEVLDLVYLSNNGRNIVASSSEADMIAFYDVRFSTEPVASTQLHGMFSFSNNGEFFISVDSKLTLRKADGSMIWEKNTGTEAYKRVVISDDGSYIVMASSEEPNITDFTIDQVDQQDLYHPTGNQISEDLKDGLIEERARARRESKDEQPAKKTEDMNLLQKVATPRQDRKVFLSFLKGDGTLLEQTSVKLRIPQILAISPEGKYTVLSCDSTLLFYETETGTLLWKKTFSSVNWWMQHIELSSDGNMIALGVKSDRSDRQSPFYLCLLNKDGSELGRFQLEHSPNSNDDYWGPIVAFTEDERYILTATLTKKCLFRIDANSK